MIYLVNPRDLSRDTDSCFSEAPASSRQSLFHGITDASAETPTACPYCEAARIGVLVQTVFRVIHLCFQCGRRFEVRRQAKLRGV
jgi:hypothetical protein